VLEGRARSIGVVLLLAAATLAACGGGDADDGRATTSRPEPVEAPACASAVDDIAGAAERYLRTYAGGGEVTAADAVSAAEGTAAGPGDDEEALDETGFQEALAAAQDVLSARRCDPMRTQTLLEERLAEVDAEGPVADAVLRQLTATLTGRMPVEPTETTVAAGDDLREALAMAPDGSTLVLEPGEHRVDHTLVLLAGVEVRGAGRDATSIVSTAPEAAVLVLTDQLVSLEDLTVRHEGDAPASVILGGPAAAVAVSGVRVSGARAAEDGRGGAGILMFGAGTEAAGRGTTLEVTDAELIANEAGGIVLTGGHRSSIVRALFAGNGQCGICFLDASDGSVEDSGFEGNGVGIAATGSARPALVRITVTGGEVGLQAADEAAPAVQGATISGTSRAAVILSGAVTGSLEGVSCTDVAFGIVVGPDVRPVIGETSCDVVPAGS
jgi:hypothetical protein